jgi:2-polyprenyl-3-methyl-5-hydroxy-6-metoxy-1,4-benzoquinol methylase
MPNQSEIEHWESRYLTAERPPWDTGRPSAELVRRLGQFPIPRTRAVEFGCGTGTNAVWLAQQGFDVTGLDISPTAIRLAEQQARAAGVAVRFLAADVTELPDLGEPFPFFFDRGCYHAVRRVNAAGFLRELDRFTAPGAWGVVLTGNANEERKPGPPTVSEATLRSELGRLFEFVSLEEFRFDQGETDGHHHLGWSCVLRKR